MRRTRGPAGRRSRRRGPGHGPPRAGTGGRQVQGHDQVTQDVAARPPRAQAGRAELLLVELGEQAGDHAVCSPPCGGAARLARSRRSQAATSNSSHASETSEATGGTHSDGSDGDQLVSCGRRPGPDDRLLAQVGDDAGRYDAADPGGRRLSAHHRPPAAPPAGTCRTRQVPALPRRSPTPPRRQLALRRQPHVRLPAHAREHRSTRQDERCRSGRVRAAPSLRPDRRPRREGRPRRERPPRRRSTPCAYRAAPRSRTPRRGVPALLPPCRTPPRTAACRCRRGELQSPDDSADDVRRPGKQQRAPQDRRGRELLPLVVADRRHELPRAQDDHDERQECSDEERALQDRGRAVHLQFVMTAPMPVNSPKKYSSAL